MEPRQHPRVAVDRHIACEANDRRLPVFLYDLSIGGCMFESDELALLAGQDVSLILAASPHAAVVVWSVGQCVGAKFRSELPAIIVTHYGFTPDTATRFDALAPRDRFGRLLPPLSKLCG